MMRLVHKFKQIKRSKIVVISGPSAGVGKDTVLRLFLKKHPNWVHPVSTTTRKPRAGEIKGKNMNFVDAPTFKTWQKAGKFIETAKINGNFYGTLKAPVDLAIKAKNDVILRVDVNGALKLKKLYPTATLFFIVAESDADLEARLRGRATEKETELKQRLTLAKKEARMGYMFDYTIVNPKGAPETAVAEIEKIIDI